MCRDVFLAFGDISYRSDAILILFLLFFSVSLWASQSQQSIPNVYKPFSLFHRVKMQGVEDNLAVPVPTTKAQAKKAATEKAKATRAANKEARRLADLAT